jgi:hypothetical protein
VAINGPTGASEWQLLESMILMDLDSLSVLDLDCEEKVKKHHRTSVIWMKAV